MLGIGNESESFILFCMNFQIAFRGIKGTEFSSDIAIDSIRIRSGAC